MIGVKRRTLDVKIPDARRSCDSPTLAPASGAPRDFASRINIGMIGINVPIPVPLAYHSFGGWKASSFGDLNQHGTDSIKFWTRTKTVTARWPSGIKGDAEFVMPTMK